MIAGLPKTVMNSVLSEPVVAAARFSLCGEEQAMRRDHLPRATAALSALTLIRPYAKFMLNSRHFHPQSL